MHFRLATTFSLAATAFAVVIPREDGDLGSWAASYASTSAANGFKSTKLTAIYSNSNLNDTITAVCSYELNPASDPAEMSSCEPASFDYTLVEEGEEKVLSLTQTVDLWGGPVTVFGDAPIVISCESSSGTSCAGEATVKVTRAIA